MASAVKARGLGRVVLILVCASVLAAYGGSGSRTESAGDPGSDPTTAPAATKDPAPGETYTNDGGIEEQARGHLWALATEGAGTGPATPARSAPPQQRCPPATRATWGPPGSAAPAGVRGDAKADVEAISSATEQLCNDTLDQLAG